MNNANLNNTKHNIRPCKCSQYIWGIPLTSILVNNIGIPCVPMNLAACNVIYLEGFEITY